MLCPCNITSHSTRRLMSQCGIASVGNVWHLGSHDGIEADIYDYFNAKRVRWFECNPLVIPYLKQRIGGRNNHFISQLCLWNKSGIEMDFQFYLNETYGAASVFGPAENYEQYVTDAPPIGKSVKVKTTKLDDYISQLGLQYEVDNITYVNMDVQGAERQVLEGAHLLLTGGNLEYVQIEVSNAKIYEGGSTATEVDELMARYNFSEIGYLGDRTVQYDAMYARK